MKINKKELFINIIWLLAILGGMLSIPVAMVALSKPVLPGEISFTVPEKRWVSPLGYECIDPAHIVECRPVQEK